MCLIFISLSEHPAYKLIVAANRDEFYERKTEAASFWRSNPQILGGRDLEAGGSWMGITRGGRIALVTNYRDPRNIDPNAPSRGHLVSRFLENTDSASSYLEALEKEGHRYNGYNLVVGTANELWYMSNYRKGVLQLSHGLHGLSNHLLNTPWPKVERGKEKLNIILNKKELHQDELFSFLYDSEVAQDQVLPDTGIGLERERALSAMFIKTHNYGTRCSTVLLVDRNEHAVFAERIYDLKTFESTTRTFEFDLAG